MTPEECATYYKWANLQKEILKEECFEIEGPAGTIQYVSLIGVAKKS